MKLIDSLHWFLMYFARFNTPRDSEMLGTNVVGARKISLSELAAFNLMPYIAFLFDWNVWWQVVLCFLILIGFYFFLDMLERNRYGSRHSEGIKYHRKYSRLPALIIILIRIITVFIVCVSPLMSLAISFWI